MGMTWKAMTLLSILAALVIIVYSAEEDFEPDYRDVRPRRFDSITPNYEQPWRIIDMEPAATQPSQPDWVQSSQEEPPKRRRQGRKRKRRPPPTSEEDLIPQERHVYLEKYRPYQQEKFNTQSGIIRRRRKQFDSRQSERPNSWKDETVDADRPLLRKRGNKRKRPIVEESWPELSEFKEFQANGNTGEYIENAYTQSSESLKNADNNNYDQKDQVNLHMDDTIVETGSHERHQVVKNKNEMEEYSSEYIPHAVPNETDITNDKQDEDKSLSEFSQEIQPPSDDIISTHEKLSDKAVGTLSDVEKAQSNETLDPQILKEILKKSNGRSLSEILQQHNLSLVDLLHGKEKAISILIEDSPRDNHEDLQGQFNKYAKVNNESDGLNAVKRVTKGNREYQNRNIEQKPKESVRNTVIIRNIDEGQAVTSTQTSVRPGLGTENTSVKLERHKEVEIINHTEKTTSKLSSIQDSSEITETTTKPSIRRRFPVGSRRKLRMRPMNNTTYKSQLNRDLIALTSRRYQHSKNLSRSREWKDVMPTLVKIYRKDDSNLRSYKNIGNHIITTTFIPDETTVQQSFEDTKLSTLPDITESDTTTTNSETDVTFTESTQTPTTTDFTENISTTTSTSTSTDLSTTTSTTTTEKPSEKSLLKPAVKASDLRRQAFNNRLKRKRLKQKTTTTESTQEYAMKNIFGMANLVSASEFIAKVQPRTTSNDEELDFTTLEDFITTESTFKPQTKFKSQKLPKTQYSTTQSALPVQDMEETAKIEIEEILNDTLTSARLSKILKERNMTINELVEHRERGSSHIHLADIFHNASREPNPPEPFLSKSLIEPISKETYPLRALLEANLHDPTGKATALESNLTYSNNINIPVVMDFGNNVNENGENMGIMSLFDNFTNVQDDAELKGQRIEKNTQFKELNGNYKYDTSRESRLLNTNKDSVTWKEIIAIMQRGQENNTNQVVELLTKELSPAPVPKKFVIDDLADDVDTTIVVNELHHHNGIDSNLMSDEDIPYNLREKTELPRFNGIPNNTSNSAKSVTVATASIIGLAMVLFLLTYVVFRWKQRRNFIREKECLRRDRIPTPVFENRKGHKINSSTRSKSPMISSSNIYTIETSDMRNGNDSPEYMWDSLRKPFQ